MTLYLPEAGPDDALWSGPTVSPAAVGALLGVNVAPLKTLEARLVGSDVATLPAPDAETRAQQSQLLGRSILSRGATPDAVASPGDAALADAVIGLRLRHDDAAVAELRLAAEATALAHRAGMLATRAGLRESVVRAAMEAALTARGCATAYPSIVTVHGEILHNETHHNVLAPGDLLLADVGGESPGGWAGDVTRTWPVDGRYTTPRLKSTMWFGRPSGRRSRRSNPARATGTFMDWPCWRWPGGFATWVCSWGIRQNGSRTGRRRCCFPHGVGHLLGLDVHDMEDLGDRAGYAPGRHRSTEPGWKYLRLDWDLLPGMAVTIEPGIYFVPALARRFRRPRPCRGAASTGHGWKAYRHLRGIRIEDDVLVTPVGVRGVDRGHPQGPARRSKQS